MLKLINNKYNHIVSIIQTYIYLRVFSKVTSLPSLPSVNNAASSHLSYPQNTTARKGASTVPLTCFADVQSHKCVCPSAPGGLITCSAAAATCPARRQSSCWGIIRADTNITTSRAKRSDIFSTCPCR